MEYEYKAVRTYDDEPTGYNLSPVDSEKPNNSKVSEIPTGSERSSK